MSSYKYLLTGALCLLLNLAVHAQMLQQKVSLSLKNVNVQAALLEMQNNFGLQFSYLNNDLPQQANVSLSVKNATVEEVLDKLLANTALGYTERKGQIIISKSLPKKEPKTATMGPVKAAEQEQAPLPAPVEKELRPQAPAEEAPATVAVLPSLPEAYQPLPPPSNLYASVDRNIFSKLQTQLESKKENYHVGIIYPLSTHGREAGNYVNSLSLHLLVGYDAGLEGFEASGFGNIENDYARGAQFAGFFNVVKNEVQGFQGAGFLNFVGDSLLGVQAAGFSNFTRRHLRGYQAAGFANLAGSIQGIQAAGFGNITESVLGAQLSGFGGIASEVDGAQLSGFGSLAAGVKGAQLSGFGSLAKTVRGVQGGGFGNIAKHIDGAQLAGFGNIAARVEGVQASGFLNVAGRVKGAQLGFLNIADTVDGVSIGFLSLVRRGYHHPEVWTAEDFEANVALKLGVRSFYNIFAASSDLEGERWSLGYGFGAQWPLGRRFHLNTDLMSSHVFEEAISEGWPDELELNLLNKFRLLFGWQFARHFSLFAGPTYNVMVSQYQNAEGTIGSSIPQSSFYNKTFSGETNVQMWVGFNAGVRF